MRARRIPGSISIGGGRRAFERRDRLPSAARAPAAARLHGRGDAGISGHDRRAHGGHPRRAARHRPRPARMSIGGTAGARRARVGPGVRSRGRAAQPRRHQHGRPGAPAPPRMARPASRRNAGPSWRCRRCSPALPTSRSRSSDSRSTIWQTPMATCGSRWSPIGPTPARNTRTGDDGDPGRGAARHRAAERPPRAGARRRRPVPRPAPAATSGMPRERVWMGWERKRGKLHELNRLLRGATDTSFLDDADGRTRTCRPGCATCVTLDADTRVCRSARSSGWWARWRIRSTGRDSIRWRGAWWRDTASCNRASPPPLPGREGSVFQRLVSGAPGDRPVRGGGVGRLSGSLRRGIVYRQGDLRHRRLRGGAGGTGARQFAAEPRPVRRAVRARRPGDRRRAVRKRAGKLPDGRGAPASLGARRLAAAPLDRARTALGR